MFCTGLGYAELPRDLRKDVTYINFQDNALVELNRTTLEGFSNLQRLLLSANRIERLAVGAFRHTRRLAALDLSLNRLAAVPPGVLAPLRQLVHLNLAHNNLSSIDGALGGLARLRTLSLHNNRIASIDPSTFADVAHSLRYIDLTNNALLTLAGDTFSRLRVVTHLLLSHNPLGELGSSGSSRLAGTGAAGSGQVDARGGLRLTIRSPYVRQLAMRNCSLTAVPYGLPRSLADLNLAENRIRVVRRSHFGRQTALVSLDLSYNALHSIDAKAFRSALRLERLLLASNRLSELPASGAWPESLVTLRLDNNAVESLDRSTFARSSRLQELGLSNNALRRLHPATFANMTRLRLLTLNRNFIAHLPPRVFANLSRLMSLDLSDNPLQELPYGVFQSLTSLDSLRLCSIRTPTTVDAPLLQGARALRILDLDGSPPIAAGVLQHDLRLYSLQSVQYLNMMRTGTVTLDATFPQYLPAVRVLQLSDNPWRCDRALHWLQRWLTVPSGAGTASVQHREYVRCAAPRELAGRRVIELLESDWLIHERHQRRPAAAGGAATAAVPLASGSPTTGEATYTDQWQQQQRTIAHAAAAGSGTSSNVRAADVRRPPTNDASDWSMPSRQ